MANGETCNCLLHGWQCQLLHSGCMSGPGLQNWVAAYCHAFAYNKTLLVIVRMCTWHQVFDTILHCGEEVRAAFGCHWHIVVVTEAGVLSLQTQDSLTLVFWLPQWNGVLSLTSLLWGN